MAESEHEEKPELHVHPTGPSEPWTITHAGVLSKPLCTHTEECCVDEGGYYVIYCARAECQAKKMSFSHAYAHRLALMMERHRQKLLGLMSVVDDARRR